MTQPRRVAKIPLSLSWGRVGKVAALEEIYLIQTSARRMRNEQAADGLGGRELLYFFALSRGWPRSSV